MRINYKLLSLLLYVYICIYYVLSFDGCIVFLDMGEWDGTAEVEMRTTSNKMLMTEKYFFHM